MGGWKLEFVARKMCGRDGGGVDERLNQVRPDYGRWSCDKGLWYFEVVRSGEFGRGDDGGFGCGGGECSGLLDPDLVERELRNLYDF